MVRGRTIPRGVREKGSYRSREYSRYQIHSGPTLEPSKYGLPRASALIIIVDPETLIPSCVMDGAIVSAMRTGAAAGVAAKYLANGDSKIFGLVGASVQGRTQLMGMKKAVPSLETCRVYDINKKRRKNLQRR